MKQPPKSLKELREHGNVEFPCAFYSSLREETHVGHHWHEELELLYVEGSDYSVEIDTRESAVSEPAFYFINQEQIHAARFSESALEYALVFRADMLSYVSYDLAQQKLLQPLISRKLSFPTCVPLAAPAGKALGICLLPLFKEGLKRTPAGLLQTKAALCGAVAVLADHNLLLAAETAAPRESQRILTIKQLLSYIQENYTRRIYLKELADFVGMDPQYLCRFFKKSLGQTPMEYINSLRIEKACQALRDTDNKILDICYDSGFQNMGHFIHCFKEHKSMTPSAYRALPRVESSVAQH